MYVLQIYFFVESKRSYNPIDINEFFTNFVVCELVLVQARGVSMYCQKIVLAIMKISLFTSTLGFAKIEAKEFWLFA